MKITGKCFLSMIGAVLMLALAASYGTAKAEDMKSAQAMTMHHMHMMVNHGLEMAAEGSNMVMLGQMGMAKGVDDVSTNHGKMMIEMGKKLIEEMMTGPEMTRLHEEGVGMDDPLMAYTHQLGDAALNYIALLEKMAPTPHTHQ